MDRFEFCELLDRLEKVADTPQPGVAKNWEWPVPVKPSELKELIATCRMYNDLVDARMDEEENGE